MVETAEKIYDQTKQSLEEVLREKAFSEVKELFEEKGIDINSVKDTDIEVLVGNRVKEMMSSMKDFTIGTFVAFAITSIVGV